MSENYKLTIMKELSIEGKAKAYDNIIEKANKMYSENCETCQMCIEELIPELTESEDERIRKVLIELSKEVAQERFFTNRGTNLQDVIAWLEKQGNLMGALQVANKEIGELVEENYYLKEQGEQNPAWSEEDELHIRELESLVKRVWAIAEHENDKDTIHEMSDLSFFLKTLKPQLKQEWSEEEIEKAAQEWDSKANFNPFHMTMDGDKPTGVKQDITTHKESFKAGVNWILKSLRPQNHWKPSDEQMRVLDLAIRCGINRGTTEETTLVSLFNDLKKLE